MKLNYISARPNAMQSSVAERPQRVTRVNTSVLAASEKRALIWIAQRLPAWVNSDHLTVLGFVSLLAAGAAYWYASVNRLALLLVIPLLVLNWFGDSLDGTLARVRHRQRPRYGFYVDHLLDATGTFALMSGLAFSGFMNAAVAYAFLIVYLLLSIEIYLATHALGTFKLSFWNFGPTELRILLIVGNLFALRNPIAMIAGRPFLLFDVGFAIGAAALAIIFVQAAVTHTTELYRQEPL
jgi:archaetidylinositol phosphate synthase